MDTPAQAPHPPRPLSRVGGNLALDFINTIDDPLGPGRFDHLAQPSQIVGWANAAELLSSDALSGELDASELVARVHEFRAVLRKVFEDVVCHEPPRAEVWARVRTYLATAVSHAELVPVDSRFELRWRAESPADMLWPIVHSAVQLLTGADAAKIKQCAGCPWLFVDRSKNHSRRWCDMGDCGSSEKSRRFVERRRARTNS